MSVCSFSYPQMEPDGSFQVRYRYPVPGTGITLYRYNPVHSVTVPVQVKNANQKINSPQDSEKVDFFLRQGGKNM
jgi:hypothetical protein